MKLLHAPLVGMRFRPPALTIVQGLGMDEPLTLQREPENKFDPNAVQIWTTQDWVDDSLELAGEAKAEASSLGLESIAEDIDHGNPVFLGFIAATFAKDWAPILDSLASEGKPWPKAKLTFAASGGPQVSIEVEEEGVEEPEEEEETGD